MQNGFSLRCKIEEEKQDIDYPSNSTMNHEDPPNNLGGEECLHYFAFSIKINIELSIVDQSFFVTIYHTVPFSSHLLDHLLYTRKSWYRLLLLRL